MSNIVCSNLSGKGKLRYRRRKKHEDVDETNDDHSEHQKVFLKMFRHIARLMMEIEREKVSNSRMGNMTCWICNSRRNYDRKGKEAPRFIDESLEIQPCNSTNYQKPLTLPPIYKGVELPVVQRRNQFFPTPCRGPIKDVEWSVLSNCRYLRPALPKYSSNDALNRPVNNIPSRRKKAS